jgi:Leu/Phe-tRNA-protein transferase
MSVDPQKQHMTLRMMGARKLNRERWAQVVAKVTEACAARFDMCRFDSEPMRPNAYRFKHVVCGPGEMPIGAQMVLDIEMALLEASMVAQELEALGASDLLDEGYRVRMHRTLQQAIAAIEKRLQSEKRAHLRVVDNDG